MPRCDVNVDDVIREYRAGKSGKHIARELGVSPIVIYHRLRDANEPRRLSGPPRPDLPIDDVVSRYRGGWSVAALAKYFSVSRTLMTRRLAHVGIAPRTQSEAERVKWSHMGPSARRKQVAAAHAASRGRVLTMHEKLRRARTVQRKGLHITPDERRLTRLLQERGVDVVHQQAIGPYNCDLGAFPVAVEIFGGHWHWHGRHLLRTPDRFRYILDAGWHLLVVALSRPHPLTNAVADYVTTEIKRMRRLPTTTRQYRVVRGAGQLLAAGRADDQQISIKWALTRGRDSRGRYTTLPR